MVFIQSGWGDLSKVHTSFMLGSHLEPLLSGRIPAPTSPLSSTNVTFVLCCKFLFAVSSYYFTPGRYLVARVVSKQSITRFIVSSWWTAAGR
jgi:hypothetical protein